jgi:hypothetical protein
MMCCLPHMTPGLEGLDECLTRTHAGAQVISLSIDHVIKVWDLRNNECTQTVLLLPHSPPPFCMQVCASDSRILNRIHTYKHTRRERSHGRALHGRGMPKS